MTICVGALMLEVNLRFGASERSKKIGHLLLLEPDNRGHAIAARKGVLHALAAELHYRQRISKAQGAAGYGSAESAHRKAGRRIDPHALMRQGAHHRDAGNQRSELHGHRGSQRRLRIQGRGIHSQHCTCLCQRVLDERVLGQAVQKTR